MRLIALLGCAAIVAGCSTKETSPAGDSAMAADSAAAAAPHVSLASLAAIWNVVVKPEGKDSVATTYVLNTTDTTAWLFAFNNDGKPIPMRVDRFAGDTVYTSTDWFDSSVRPGMKARTDSRLWMQDGKLIIKTTAHYQNAGADSVRVFDSEGTRQ